MKVAWVTLGARNDRSTGQTYLPDVSEADGNRTSALASVRLRALIPMEALRARGCQAELLQVDAASLEACSARLTDFDAILFQKTLPGGEIAAELFDRAVAAGVPTLFDICDLRVDEQSDTGRRNLKLLRTADRVVTSTPALADALRPMGARDVAVITDPYEGPRGEPAWKPNRDRLKLLWFGHPSNLETLQGLLSDLVAVGRERPIQLTLLTGRVPELPGLCKEFNQRWRHVVATRYAEWSPGALWDALAATDAVVIPSRADAPDKLVKSPNRVVEALWAGRCVVANPLPAYVPFAEWSFIDDSIRHGLERALAEQDQIPERIRAAQAYIAEVHSPERIGEQWESVIRDTVESRRASGTRPLAIGEEVQGDVSGARTPRRLNLGCGDKILPGYINVDVAESRAGKKPDVICDLRQLTSFENESADEILSVHVIEHFWRWEALDILKEWVRVLRPGGTMILECPNLLSACEALLANPDAGASPGEGGQRTMWVFYGDPAWHDPLMVHRWGYTPRSLAQLMEEAGLANVRQEPAQFKLREPRDMRVVGEKPR
jgi:glycosyltransferase involved in cell wall biosynthesis